LNSGRCYAQKKGFREVEQPRGDACPNAARDETFVTETSAHRPTTLLDYLAILRRRKLIIIAVPVVAALAAFQYSSSQPSVYQAYAQVLVQRSDEAASDPTRYLTTQARVARSSKLAARIAAAKGVPRMTAGEILANSKVTADAEADLLNISVSSGNPRDAEVLANAYAREFTEFKIEQDTARIDKDLRAVKAQAAGLRMRGGAASIAYQTLMQRQSDLELERLAAEGNTSVLQPATGATKVQPRPRRALILGGLLGAVLALGLAFLAEALDRRVRTEDEIQELLGLPLLGRVSRPPSSARETNGLVMLTEPMGVRAEEFRKLWGAIEFVNIQRGAASRTIMFTSAAQREGKSTTVANLAIALARSGRRVALVDLDLRRPSLHTFFGIDAEPGFTDVVVGRETLDRAVRHLSLPTAGGLESLGERNGQPSAPSSVPSSPPADEAILHFLPCGTIPPTAGEFLASERVSALLSELREQFDVLLVDAPPITVVGDAMTVSGAIEAIIAVTSLRIERPLLDELARELQNCRAATLGFVLAGAPLTERYHAYHYPYRPRVDRPTRPGEGPDVATPLGKGPTTDEAFHAPSDDRPRAVDAGTGPREDVTQSDGRA
jgi:polysaccharide biosynthesis transport protein